MSGNLLVLVALDQKKSALTAWVGKHLAIISTFDVVCNGTTGGVLLNAYPKLRITRLATLDDIPLALSSATADLMNAGLTPAKAKRTSGR